MDDEGPLVPEERGGLSEAHTLVDRALADEIVEEILALGTKGTHAVTRDCEEVIAELLHSTFELVVLLLLTQLGGSTKFLSGKGKIGREELILDGEVNEGLSQGDTRHSIDELVSSVGLF